MDEKTEKIRSMLWAQQKWPGIYYFKFIVPNDGVKLELVKKLFLAEDDITYRTSSDIRYISVSCKKWMKNPDAVLDFYQAASKIEGVIAL